MFIIQKKYNNLNAGYKVTVTSFCRTTFSYSAVQQPFDFNVSWSLDYIRKLAFNHLGETMSLPLCVQPTYGAYEYQTCTDHALSVYQFTTWSSGATQIHFLCCQEKFTLGL